MNNIKARQLDLYMASVIFIVSILELLSWHFSKGKAAVITDYGNNYLVWYYPLLSTCIIWFFSLFFFLKILRYNSCVYTSIVSSVYFLVQTINGLSFLLGFGMGIYEKIVYPLLLISVVVITLTKIIRWCLR